MERREFLKRAGVGSIALASAPVLAGALAGTALADTGGWNFHFQANVKNPGDAVTDVIILSGAGKVVSGTVVAAGSFTHFDATKGTASSRPVVASGTWKAKRLISFQEAGTYGAHAAGRVTMEVVLVTSTGARIPARMEMTCNVGPGGLAPTPAKPEGLELTLGSVTFVPLAGLTAFTTGVEERD